MGHDSAKMTMLGLVWELLGDPRSIFGDSFNDLWKIGRSVKTISPPSLFADFCRLGPPPAGPGGCLGWVWGTILEDVGSKMVLFALSWCAPRGRLRGASLTLP